MPDDQLPDLSAFGEPVSPVDALVDTHAARAGVPRELLAALVKQESGGNPRAVNAESGAAGAGQLMPATARELGVTDRFDPNQSIGGAADYLRQGLDAYGGDVDKALMRYYGGPNENMWGPRTAAYPSQVKRHLPAAGAPDFSSFGDPVDVSAPASPSATTSVPTSDAPAKSAKKATQSAGTGIGDFAKEAALTTVGLQTGDSPSTAGDYGRALGKGIRVDIPQAALGLRDMLVNGGGGGGPRPFLLTLADMAAQALGFGRQVGDSNPAHAVLDAAGKKIDESLSPAGKESAAKPVFTEKAAWENLSKDGLLRVPSKIASLVSNGEFFDAGATDMNKFGLQAIESAPLSIASMMPVVRASRFAYVATAERLTPEIGAEAAQVAAKKAAKNAASAIAAPAEGLTGGGQQYAQSYEQVQAMPEADLAKSADYQKALASLPDTMPEAERRAAARTIIARNVGMVAGAIATVVDAVGGALGDRYLGGAVAGGKGGALARRARAGAAGVIEETPTEALQSAGEQVGQNLGTQLYVDPNQKLTADVGEQAYSGAASGGIMGGVMGAGTHPGPAEKSAAQPNDPNAPIVAPEPPGTPTPETGAATPVPTPSVQPAQPTPQGEAVPPVAATPHLDEKPDAGATKMPASSLDENPVSPLVAKIDDLIAQRQQRAQTPAEQAALNQSIAEVAAERAKQEAAARKAALQQQAATEEADARVTAQRQAETEAQRRLLLDGVLEDADVRDPVGRFTAELRRAGFQGDFAIPSKDDLARIARFRDVQAAIEGEHVAEGTPNEMDVASLVPEKKAPEAPEARAPAVKLPDELVAAATAAKAMKDGPTAFFQAAKRYTKDEGQRRELMRAFKAFVPADAPAAPVAGAALPGAVAPATASQLEPSPAPAELPAQPPSTPSPRASSSAAPPSTSVAPAAATRSSEIDAAAHEAATSPKNDLPEPTDAQKEVGNYQKGHVRVGGLDLSIENPAGSKRRPEWPALKDHYGYIRRTVGADEEHIDSFVKPGTPENYDGPVFVVDQHVDGKFDEHKVMLGWPDEAAARAGYLRNYTKGWNGLKAIKQFTMPEFKDWLANGDTKAPAVSTVDSSKAALPPTRGVLETLVKAKAQKETNQRTAIDKAIATVKALDGTPESLRKLRGHANAIGAFDTKAGDALSELIDALTPKKEKKVRTKPVPKEERSPGQVNNSALKRAFRDHGIDLNEIRDITGEKQGKRTGAMPGTFSRDGETIDFWGEYLVDHGYLAPESDSERGNENQRASDNDTRDFIRKVLDGAAVHKIGDVAIAAAEHDDWLRQESEKMDGLLSPDDLDLIADPELSRAENEAAFDAAAFLHAEGFNEADAEGMIERAAIQTETGYEESIRAQAASGRSAQRVPGTGESSDQQDAVAQAAGSRANEPGQGDRGNANDARAAERPSGREDHADELKAGETARGAALRKGKKTAAATNIPKNIPAPADRFEASDQTTNEASRDLRKQSHAKEAPGDVELDNDKFVSLDTAMATMRTMVAADPALLRDGKYQSPAQLGFRLGIAPRDWTRMVDAFNAAPALTLTTQTSAELKAKDEAAQTAAAKEAETSKAAEAKAKADGQRVDFGLTGSARAADANRGQSPLFSQSRADQTQSDTFRKWFGDSAVVDGNGEPLQVFHGTARDFDSFDAGLAGENTRHPTARLGFFFSADPGVSNMFTEKWDMTQWPTKVGQKDGANTMPVYLAIRNPYTMTAAQFRSLDTLPFGKDFELEQPVAAARQKGWIDSNRAKLAEAGYDGIRVTGDPKLADTLGGDEWRADTWIAFKPEQIKSAIGNNGNFDPKNPSIVASANARPEFVLGPMLPQLPAINRTLLTQARSGTDIGSMLKTIVLKSDDPLNRVLARNFIRPDLQPKVRFGSIDEFGPDVIPASIPGSTIDALYLPGSDEIVLLNARTIEHDVLHETAHAGTYKALREGGPAAQEMEKLYAHVQKFGTFDRELYGLTSIDEFVAEVYGSQQFRDELRAIPAARGVPFKTAWDWFTNIVRKLLGLGANMHSALTQALDVGQRLVEEGAPLRARGGEPVASRTESASALFSRSKPDWVEKGSPDLQSAASKIDTYAASLSLPDRLRKLTANWKLRLVQGAVDSFLPLKDLGTREYMLARMTKGADGALEGALLYGIPKIDADGAIYGELDHKGFLGAMKDLAGEHDRFLMWVAGNRSDRLMGLGKENLWTQPEIAAMQDLNQGSLPDGRDRSTTYNTALDTLERYNRAINDIAEATGLIDRESRKVWENRFYVPFFRMMEDDKLSGPSKVKGLVRQYAFKRLKGGEQSVGDLLANTLSNWSHLLSASLANQAAVAALTAAEQAGVAVSVPADTKGATFAMIDGAPAHFEVHDPFVLEAVAAVNQAGFGGMPMRVLGAFKKALTYGVTTSPTFRIRNLMRDTIAAVAQADLSYNLFDNLQKGFKGTSKESDDYAQMLFGGGMMRFGSFTEGDRASHAKRLISRGVQASSILNTPERAWLALRAGWEQYQEFGDRMENINRSALYQTLRKQGKSHLEASFEARDLMDFSLQGSWMAMRILSQTVPFMNARAQGLYKMGRAAANDPRRLFAVTGAVALASIALLLANGDDEDWQQREDWDRDTYWWIKFGGMAYRIPKPFEIGALGTIAERSAELLLNDEFTGKDFAKRMKFMIGQTFAFNPTPQAFKPMIDLYGNNDSFTDRSIESAGMEHLSKPERSSANTSLIAQALGSAGDMTNLSPVQIDFLIRQYFGWLGTHIAIGVDSLAQPFSDVEKPAKVFPNDLPTIGDFAHTLPEPQSKYVTRFYEDAKKSAELMADIRHHRQLGNADRAEQIAEDHSTELANAKLYTHTQTQLGKVGQAIRRITADPELSADEKREQIGELTAQRNEVARRAVQVARESAEPST